MRMCSRPWHFEEVLANVSGKPHAVWLGSSDRTCQKWNRGMSAQKNWAVEVKPVVKRRNKLRYFSLMKYTLRHGALSRSCSDTGSLKSRWSSRKYSYCFFCWIKRWDHLTVPKKVKKKPTIFPLRLRQFSWRWFSGTHYISSYRIETVLSI